MTVSPLAAVIVTEPWPGKRTGLPLGVSVSVPDCAALPMWVIWLVPLNLARDVGGSAAKTLSQVATTRPLKGREFLAATGEAATLNNYSSDQTYSACGR